MTEPDNALSAEELQDFRRLAGIMVPASEEFRVPGADDEAIFADIAASLGRDRDAVRQALTLLRESAGGNFADLPDDQAEAAAMAFLYEDGPMIRALGRAVLQCYYRDDRVFLSIRREPRPPFPKGHVLPQGDWSLLEQQKGRARMWRDLDGFGG